MLSLECEFQALYSFFYYHMLNQTFGVFTIMKSCVFDTPFMLLSLLSADLFHLFLFKFLLLLLAL